ncbi:MAG: Sapep family Mn(2+)-dependent dipeptidase [Ruminococcus sp.]
MNFGKKIYEYKDSILEDLKTLLEIKSVSAESDEGPKEALNFILKRGKEMGFQVKNVEDKAGHIQLGDGGALCGALTHLDVVPAGSNWSVPPFTLTDKDGRLFGRGIIDDKGASLINLYCLKALKDSGVKGVNTLRCIYGTDEEVGMTDMETYFSKEQLPDISFTPDSNYGICYAEKGILQIKIYSDRNDGKVVSAFEAGDALNAVPDCAEVLLYSSDSEENQMLHNRKSIEGNFDFSETIDGLVIKCQGKAAHACEPYKGRNAASDLVSLLSSFYDEEELGSICTFIKNSVNNQTDGTSLGLKVRDSASGKLTCNLGTVRIDDNQAYCTLDIRYPVSVKGTDIIKHIKRCVKRKGLKAKTIHHSLPLYLSKDSKAISVLSDTYREVMGENPELYVTGGGTYARMLGNKGVAFGPAFVDDNVNMHNADESVDKENFFKHAEICLQAFYKLYTEKL